jgi:ATP-dependent helicase/nuclease subunit B
LPTQEQLANEARVELYRALASADDSLTLCRPTHDEDTPLLPALPFERVAAIVNAPLAPAAYAPTSSRGLLCALGWRDGTVQSLEELRRHELFARMPALDAFAHGESVLRARNASPEKPTPYAGRLSAALLDELRSRYGDDYQFSATELEIYARCPFRFFAERVLRLEEALEPEEEITPLDKGTVLHAIFRDFYRRWLRRGGAPIAQDNVAEALDLLRAIADEHLGKLPYRGAVWRKFRDRMTGQPLSPTASVPGLLRRFLDVEMETLARTAYRPRYLELGFGQQRRGEMLDEESCAEPLAVNARGRRVLMHGVIDRIDTSDEQQTFCVLDYKSGSNIPTMDDVRRGPSLQLPVYVLAARMLLGAGYRLAAAGYYQTKDAADCGLRSVVGDASLAEPGPGPPPSRGGALQPAEVNDWLTAEASAIARHVLGIEAGRFEVTDLDEERADCRSCDFKHICRYRGITLRTFERLS